jgi:hypothetical protein
LRICFVEVHSLLTESAQKHLDRLLTVAASSAAHYLSAR